MEEDTIDNLKEKLRRKIEAIKQKFHFKAAGGGCSDCKYIKEDYDDDDNNVYICTKHRLDLIKELGAIYDEWDDDRINYVCDLFER